MTDTYVIVSAAMLAAACILHFFTCFVFSGIVAKILGYVNVALHIALILPLLLANLDISVAVLFYMISVFVYSFLSYISARLAARRALKEDTEV